MEETLIYIFEIIGTIAFAWSGAMVGIRKNLDIFGIIVLGTVTAVGGGVIRDLLLGLTPPNMFLNPSYAIVAFLTSLLLFLVVYWKQRLLERLSAVRYERIVNFCDALGLGIFVAVGVHAGYAQGHTNRFFLIFLGIITGIGGGMMRDVMTGEMPFVLYKRVYAIAAIVGGCLAALLMPYNLYLAVAEGTGVTVLIRLLATHYCWDLPRAIRETKEKEG